MADNMNTEGLSYEDALKLINDPNFQKIYEANREPEKKEELKAPSTIEISDDATQSEVIAAFNKALAERDSFYAKLTDQKTTQLRQEQKAEKDSQMRSEVQEFAKTHKHFNDIIEDVNAFWRGGQVSLEDAYAKALKANDLKEDSLAKSESSSDAKKTTSTTPVTTPTTSDSVDADDKGAKREFTNVKDAAKDNLGKILAERPELSEAFSEE